MADEAFSESQGGETAVAAVETAPAVTEIEAPADGGQVEVEVEKTVEPSVLSVDEYGDYLVPIVVDGEEQMVPLREAQAGYQRQADYTRKAQELAQARAVKQALDTDPDRALRMLAAQYGVRFDEDPSAGQRQEFEEAGQAAAGDPMLQALQAQVAELTQYQTAQVLDQTLAGLSSKYGEHFNEQELLVAAQQAGVTHPSQLEDVYRTMMFDKFYAQATAREQAAQSASADDKAREQAVQQVQNLVSSGNGAAPGAPVSEAPAINTLDDAFAAAARQLGINL